ncbi:Crp/Fnr family transcriptional regulator [Campylobacter sp. RM9344]|uniref:Crp/Fnr family transcriptional regulator n=1 Tax=Campylobacter californiensis TaxID=1032243 RepID=A0AAW3ZS32_9BACT|nr:MULTISPECIES: Crp/Fnr family transcriptional regulator [unclassified Campylobacter]MBE2984488.1 Crp/Fnr family transcriptional regulator [Campylobacter sp. RM6883]MBE2985828.1 Crp/Fnr family transcriptional regulator [Campylobacter sp. RM12919]MBE2987943.1 Crp/Fnr family transcriptional regulator [Campylobacter sp. RM12920]MBE2994982.1 Crp/Fnr family transcriptional regulator [Campylobacter sp. RM6913]MBE3028929.1 Crp/Fnr family transcriptional regulator [Campylobacter sp. RM9344]
MKQTRLGLLDSKSLSFLSSGELLNFEHKILSKGSMLYSDDLKIVILREGLAKISFLEEGEEFILYQVQKNNITVLDPSCTMEILEDNSEVYLISVDKFEPLLDNSEFAKAYYQNILNIMLLQRKVIKSILFENAKGRIAHFLIELAKEQDLKQNGYYYLFLPFSLKVLSSFVGLKRQSASTAFNELVKDDIIRKITPHEFLIIDFEKLQSYVI